MHLTPCLMLLWRGGQRSEWEAGSCIYIYIYINAVSNVWCKLFRVKYKREGNQNEESGSQQSYCRSTNQALRSLSCSDPTTKAVWGHSMCSATLLRWFTTSILCCFSFLKEDEKLDLRGSNCKPAAVGPLNSSRRQFSVSAPPEGWQSYCNDCQQHAAPAALTDGLRLSP